MIGLSYTSGLSAATNSVTLLVVVALVVVVFRLRERVARLEGRLEERNR